MAATVHRINTPTPRTLRSTAEAFLDTIRSSNTRRSYSIALVKTVDQLDGRARDGLLAPSRPLASVTDDEIGAALESLWGTAAVNTWNARRAAVGKWLSWCREQGWTAPGVPTSAARSTPPDSDTPVRSRTAIDRLIARGDIHIREKTLWRMLYETCARADELLQVNIEDLDLPGRCCPVKSKGATPRTRRRGATHHVYVLATVYWDAGAARLLPRLIKDRTSGPVFVTHRRPGPGKYLADRDVCPDTGLARLSYDQAGDLLDDATAIEGTGTGWDLHELRHSGHIWVNPGPACSNSWPSPGTANPKTCAATSNRHRRPCATSPASSVPELNDDADQRLHGLRCFLRRYYRNPGLPKPESCEAFGRWKETKGPVRRHEIVVGLPGVRVKHVER